MSRPRSRTAARRLRLGLPDAYAVREYPHGVTEVLHDRAHHRLPPTTALRIAERPVHVAAERPQRPSPAAGFMRWLGILRAFRRYHTPGMSRFVRAQYSEYAGPSAPSNTDSSSLIR